MHVRAKFTCNTVETGPGGADGMRTYRFTPQYDSSVPEDKRFSRYTPIGELSLTVDNPAVQFEPGQAYYLDFTPVEATTEAEASA